MQHISFYKQIFFLSEFSFGCFSFFIVTLFLRFSLLLFLLQVHFCFLFFYVIGSGVTHPGYRGRWRSSASLIILKELIYKISYSTQSSHLPQSSFLFMKKVIENHLSNYIIQEQTIFDGVMTT